MVDLDAIKVVLKRLETGSMVSNSLVNEASDQLKLAEEKFNCPAQSGPTNTTQAEIAAIVERHDNAMNMGYLDHGLEVKLWDELRQLSAVR